MKNIYLLIFAAILTLTSCKEDLTASWLKIDSIELNTNTTIEGENSHDIEDAWVYMDNQPLGVWEVPCEIPILDEGIHKFTIYPGVKLNGRNETRIRYPFYTAAEQEITLVKGETVTYNPTVTYKPNLSFSGSENFEDTGTILNPELDSDTTKIRIVSKTSYPEIVKYGDNCGQINITSVDSVLQVFTDLTLGFEKARTFIELDYYNSNTFAIGLEARTTSTTIDLPLYAVKNSENNSDQWNHLYIEITEVLANQPNLVSYEYYIVAVLDEENTSGTIYLDNLKIVHFN